MKSILILKDILSKLRIRELSAPDKGHAQKLTASNIVNGERLATFPLRLRTSEGYELSTTPIQDHIGGPSQCHKARKINKTKTGKEEIKLASFAGDMITYI